ncbi:MAG: Rrf2 family transcriptional regulator [Bacteroidetes bacterium]|nr:Rrf2 family transcriptional regulator [Bacteroidota bacterium]MBS1540205.1 Rrf2 family transcriptional regulator [Bacteroidota bacterium]
MLSVSCKAAIKSVVYLGSKLQPDDRAGVKDIARFINENEHTVGKVLQKLVQSEIIHSTKGPNGGFYISDKQKTRPVITLVDAIDGLTVFEQCGLGFASCNDHRPCPFHHDFKKVRELFRKMCSENTIDDLCLQVENGLAWVGE